MALVGVHRQHEFKLVQGVKHSGKSGVTQPDGSLSFALIVYSLQHDQVVNALNTGLSYGRSVQYGSGSSL